MLRGLVVPQMEAQDIDNLADWQLAELKYERMALANGFENV